MLFLKEYIGLLKKRSLNVLSDGDNYPSRKKVKDLYNDSVFGSSSEEEIEKHRKQQGYYDAYISKDEYERKIESMLCKVEELESRNKDIQAILDTYDNREKYYIVHSCISKHHAHIVFALAMMMFVGAGIIIGLLYLIEWIVSLPPIELPASSTVDGGRFSYLYDMIYSILPLMFVIIIIKYFTDIGGKGRRRR